MDRWRIGRVGTAVLAAAALAGLAACGGDSDSGEGGDAGTVLDEEFGGHQLRDVSADGAPAAELAVEPDEHGGWNLQLETERFTFTPEQVNGEARGGQGHAHVYVDGEKFSRVYSEWYFLPAEAVGEGEHELTMTLNADDHTVWAVDGEPVAATATVTGGAHDHGEHDHGEGQGTTPPPSQADATFEFDIVDGSASPSLLRESVGQGATVRIVVTSDRADELHLHGYDETAEVGPDQPGVIEFVADQTGQFELETHDSGIVLLQLQVQ